MLLMQNTCKSKDALKHNMLTTCNIGTLDHLNFGRLAAICQNCWRFSLPKFFTVQYFVCNPCIGEKYPKDVDGNSCHGVILVLSKQLLWACLP